MVQQILDDMRTYFEAKTTMAPEEQALLQRLNDDFFPITSVSREGFASLRLRHTFRYRCPNVQIGSKNGK